MRFVFLELGDELDCTLKNASLILLATRYYLGELVDSLIDSFTATTFDCVRCQRMGDKNDDTALCDDDLPSLWLSRRTLCHSSVPTAGLRPEGVADGEPSPGSRTEV